MHYGMAPLLGNWALIFALDVTYINRQICRLLAPLLTSLHSVGGGVSGYLEPIWKTARCGDNNNNDSRFCFICWEESLLLPVSAVFSSPRWLADTSGVPVPHQSSHWANFHSQSMQMQGERGKTQIKGAAEGQAPGFVAETQTDSVILLRTPKPREAEKGFYSAVENPSFNASRLYEFIHTQ